MRRWGVFRRCSNRKIPCHVPRTNRPDWTGIESCVAVKALRRWAGMCRAMNRSFLSVISGGFGGDAVVGAAAAAIDRPYKRGSAEDAAFLMSQAEQVIIVPGYGMAVSQAQHALREMADLLKKEGVRVKYAIHPVAGRMPGHMATRTATAARTRCTGAGCSACTTSTSGTRSSRSSGIIASRTTSAWGRWGRRWGRFMRSAAYHSACRRLE